MFKLIFTLLVLFQFSVTSLNAQSTSEILDSLTHTGSYLPDFSYAGYHSGEKEIQIPKNATVIHVVEHGVIPNDGLDDSKALLAILEKTNTIPNPVLIKLPPGRIILSDILYIERSNLIMSGAGSDESGTEIYIPRPMMYLEDPEDLAELREYLVSLNKIQKEKENNIFLPFSQYAWSGGMLWTRYPGARVKSYLEKYDTPAQVIATISSAERGAFSFTVDNADELSVGDVVELQWFNKEGEDSSLIPELYGNSEIKVGSHHWNYPDLPLVRQQVEIVKIKGKTVTLKSPLLINIRPEYKVQITQWDHIEEVGLQHFKITFPHSNYIAHHVEQGNNAIYLTRTFNSWVKDVVIDNADSGILTESIANTTIEDITTIGTKKAHYTVQVGGVHHVLVKNLSVQNLAVHPLSFNTFATQSVYSDCEVFNTPILDQHSGVNHQNLFDNIKVHVNPNEDGSYPLFAGGGAGYWKPSHGSYSTFWNINVNFLSKLDRTEPILLNGMNDGPNANVVGVHGNLKVHIEYEPNSSIHYTNRKLLKVPSLYEYQLNQRTKRKMR